MTNKNTSLARLHVTDLMTSGNKYSEFKTQAGVPKIWHLPVKEERDC